MAQYQNIALVKSTANPALVIQMKAYISSLLLILALAIGILFSGFSVFQARAQGPASVADLAEGLMPAVVNISTSKKVKTLNRDNLPIPRVPEGSPFEDFFKDLFPENKNGENKGTPSPRSRNSLGSGFVIDRKSVV